MLKSSPHGCDRMKHGIFFFTATRTINGENWRANKDAVQLPDHGQAVADGSRGYDETRDESCNEPERSYPCEKRRNFRHLDAFCVNRCS